MLLLIKKPPNKEIKLSSKNKEIDLCDIIDYWPTSIKDYINWLLFLNIMEYTSDRIYNYATLLPSLLKMFSMFQISFWYNKGHDDQNKVEHISIKRINCGKQTGLSMDDMNTKYKAVITSFVSNTVLHHVGILRIIETNRQLKYDMGKHNSDCITDGPWYNTSICKKIDGKF